MLLHGGMAIEPLQQYTTFVSAAVADQHLQASINFQATTAIINNQSNAYVYWQQQPLAIPGQQTVFALAAADSPEASNFVLSMTPPPYTGLAASGTPMGACWITLTNDKLPPNAGVVLFPNVSVPPNVAVTNVPRVTISQLISPAGEPFVNLSINDNRLLETYVLPNNSITGQLVDRGLDTWTASGSLPGGGGALTVTQPAPGAGQYLVLTSFLAAVRNNGGGAAASVSVTCPPLIPAANPIGLDSSATKGDKDRIVMTNLRTLQAAATAIIVTLSDPGTSNVVDAAISGFTVSQPRS